MSFLSSLFGSGEEKKPRPSGSGVSRPPGPMPNTSSPAGPRDSSGFFGPGGSGHGHGITSPSTSSPAPFGGGATGPSFNPARPPAAGGGGGLFSGMHVSSSPAIATGGGPPAAGGSGFSFMAPGATATPPTAPPPATTSFSFLAPAATMTTDPATGQMMFGGGGDASVADAAASGFAFLASAATSAPPPATTSAAASLAGLDFSTPPPAPAPSLLPGLGAEPSGGDGVGLMVQPAGVKKKPRTFRPGYEAANVPAPTVASGAGGSASMLAGLVVHDAAVEGDGDPRPAEGHDSGGGILAGLRVRGGSDAVEGDVDGGGHGRTDRAYSQASGAGGLLAGLQVRPAPADPPAFTSPASTGTSTSVSRAPLPGGARRDSSPMVDNSAAATAGGFSAFGSLVGAHPVATPAAPVVPAPIPAPAPPPPRSSSPTSRVKAAVSDFADAARRNRERLTELKARGRVLLDDARRAEEDIRAVRERLARVESQQDDAMRAEQFDVAESLNATLETLRSALASAEATKRRIATDRSALDAEQTEAFNETLACTTETFMGMKRYVDERESTLTTFRRDATGRHTATRDRLANEEEQLRLKEEHVALDTKLVEEETQQVERAIADQTNELDTQVAEMRTRHARLVSEVAELERLLEEKRREERVAASQLSDTESKIRSIRAKFDKQTRRLQQKRAAVDGEIAECQNEAKALAAGRREFAITKKKDHVSEVNLLRQVDYGTTQLGTAEGLRAVLMAQAEARHTWASTASAAAAATASLQTAVDDGRRALRELQSKKAALEVQAATVRATIANIDSKTPQLNEEKKLAVTERKFKEASRLTAELKRLGDQREEAEKELSGLLSGLDEADHDIVSQKAAVAERQAALTAHEEAVDAARVDTLRGALRNLRRSLRQLCRPPKRFTTAGLRRALVKEGLTALHGGLSVKDAAVLSRRLGELAFSAQLEDPMVPDYEPPAPVTDVSLGIQYVGDRHLTPIQLACKEVLEAERDMLVEELTRLCVKVGANEDLGPETESEAEPDVEAMVITVKPAAAPTPAPAPGAQEEGVVSPSTGEGGDDEGDTSPIAATAGAAGVEDAHSTDSGEVGVEVAVAGGSPGVDAHVVDEATFTSTDELQAAMAGELAAEYDAAAAVGGAGASADDHADEAGAEGWAAPTSGRSLEEEVALLQQEMASVTASIKEKEDVIAAAVAREDFDAADAAQVDVDSFNDLKASIVARASALGVAHLLDVHESPYTTSAAVTVDAGAGPANVEAPVVEEAAPPATTAFSFLAAVATPAEVVAPVSDGTVTAFPFTLATHAPADEAAVTEGGAASALPFTSALPFLAPGGDATPSADDGVDAVAADGQA